MKKLLPLTALALLISMPALANMDSDMARKHDTMFNKIDANGDGMISSMESKDFAERKFHETDLNNDGLVTRDEMRRHMADKKARMDTRRGRMSPAAGN